MNHICPHCNLELTTKDFGIENFDKEITLECPYCKTELEYSFSKNKFLLKYIYSIVASLIVLFIKFSKNISYGPWEALFYIPLFIVTFFSIYKVVQINKDMNHQGALTEKNSAK